MSCMVVTEETSQDDKFWLKDDALSNMQNIVEKEEISHDDMSPTDWLDERATPKASALLR